MCHPTKLDFLTVYVPIEVAMEFLQQNEVGDWWMPSKADYIGLIQPQCYRSGIVRPEHLLALVVFDVDFEQGTGAPGDIVPFGHIRGTIISDHFNVDEDEVHGKLREHIRILAKMKGLSVVKMAANESGYMDIGPASLRHFQETAVVLTKMAITCGGGHD